MPMVRANPVRIMRNIALFIAVLAAFIFVSPKNAQAAQFSGAYLLHVCGVNPHGLELVPGGHIACQAYIAGVLDYHNLMRSLGTAPGVDFCVPPKTSMETLQKHVYAYVLRNKEQHGSFTAAPAVALALYNAYPCKKRK